MDGSVTDQSVIRMFRHAAVTGPANPDLMAAQWSLPRLTSQSSGALKAAPRSVLRTD